MRLKLSVESGEGRSRDVLVTCDATVTVGDAAAALVGLAPEEARSQPLTLVIFGATLEDARVLNPLLTVQESGVRSGARAGVVPFVTQNLPPADVRARVTVESGPDAGMTVPLGSGVGFVGRDTAADVRLRDPLASRRHASITVGNTIVVRDLNSANGIEVDGERTDRAILTVNSRVTAGDTTFRVQPTIVGGIDSADATPFTRSPRVPAIWRTEELPPPELPNAGERPRLPWIGVVAPIIMGAALFALTRNPLMLVFIALSPVLMAGMWVDQRLRFRRQQREQLERFRDGLKALRDDLENRRVEEQDARLKESPSTLEVLKAIELQSPLLWTRMPEHAAFLTVRLGLGELPAATRVDVPPRRFDAQEEWAELQATIEEYASVPGVPVVERFRDAGAIGVAGEHAPDVARALLLQLAGLHSPADLAICVLTAGEDVDHWSWIKWLPHIDSPHNPISAPLAGDIRSGTRLLAELEELAARRRAERGSVSTVRSHLQSTTPGAPGLWQPVEREPVTPAVLVVVVGDPSTDRGRLVAVADDGADVGIHFLWMSARHESLPVVCRTSVVAEPWSTEVRFVRHGALVKLDHTETLAEDRALAAAIALSPVEDLGAPVLDESDLPHQLSFVEMFDDDITEETGSVVTRWSKSDSLVTMWKGSPRAVTGLGAVVGQGTAAPFRIDLRRDGPHALVGGTTGAGKSEFLQTWILGMAVETSPDRLTFLLVDYKGGSAFGAATRLPHTVGLVTDLTPHLVRRALTSLRAEVRRREELLATKGAKDLITLEERGDAEAPPALVIVIDEFAALVAEVPEFVDGVIDIAQRGRSLGLHLVMATQRPAGVIRESLRANTNLRVALRVADEADSQDVLGTNHAAHFDPGTPGRAAAKLGAGRILDFQTAYVGGRSSGQPLTEVDIRDFPFAPGAVWATPRGSNTLADGPRDIERIVENIREAASELRLLAPRRPWLDALPAVLDLADLSSEGEGLVVGVADDPARQAQFPFRVDLDSAGNVAVFGAGGTGKSATLRTIAAAASRGKQPVWVYAVDFAGAGLSALQDLPTTGAVVAGTDTERIRRLFQQLTRWAGARARRFADAHAATLADYNRISESPEPRVIILLDGMTAFRAEHEFADQGRLFDQFQQLLSMGRQVGIHFVVTADRPGAFPQAMLSTFQQRIVLRLANEADYDIIGVRRDVLEDAAPGRALCADLEVQLAVTGGTRDLATQSKALRDLGTSVPASAPPRIERLGEAIPWLGLPARVGARPTLGVADDTLEPVGIPEGLFVITGPFTSGRTTAMRTAIHSTLAAHPDWQPFLLAARPSGLQDAAEWTGHETDPESAEHLATALIDRISRSDAVNGARSLIVVEGVADFEATAAEAAIARLMKAARRSNVSVLAEADTVTSGSAWQIYTELKTARAGIVLQPEESDGAGLFRVQFPRATRSDFPQGRGFFVDAGRIRRVQVALPPE